MAAKKTPATMREVRVWASEQTGELEFHGVRGIIPAAVVKGFEKATRRKVGVVAKAAPVSE